eukprot:scaffold249306_cov73-Cyclotella_meneghiniana.AAC.14
MTTKKLATQSSTFGNNIVKCGPANAVDGDRASFTHTNKVKADPNPVWTHITPYCKLSPVTVAGGAI